MKLINYTLAFFALGAVSLNAQTVPEGTVNEQGQLVLPGMDPIDPPSGTVTPEGDLDLGGGNVVVKPDASIDAGTGNLVLGDGTTLTVPSIPVTLFWNNLYEWPGLVNAWYSPVFGNFWTAPGNWTYWENWSLPNEGSTGWVYIHTVAGNGDGFWAFHTYFNTWVYYYTGGEGDTRGFSYLAADTDLQAGNFYVFGVGFFFYQEYAPDGAGKKTGWVFGPGGEFFQIR